MTSPVEPFPEAEYMRSLSQQRSSEEEGTVISHGDHIQRAEQSSQHMSSLNGHGLPRVRLQLDPVDARADSFRNMKSPSQTREQTFRLEDDLRILEVEQRVEREAEASTTTGDLDLSREKSAARRIERPSDTIDDFEAATNPLHESTRMYKPPAHPSTRASKFFKRIHQSSFLVRYFTYIVPVVLIILIPLLVGALTPVADHANVGGVKLVWFCIWLEIVWLTLWLSRIIAKSLPWPIGVLASLFTNNNKKWRDMVKELELSSTLFFWWLAIEISFLPTMTTHHVDGSRRSKHWEAVMNKVLVSFFVAAILNFFEKIIIQLIAISFHQRTYADRIELNKFQIGSLTKVYTFSKMKLMVEDSDFEPQSGPGSGARTPGVILEKAQKSTKEVFHRFGDVAGKIAGDFTGRAVTASSDPSQVILTLLNTTTGSQVLARRLYRTFAREDTETVHAEDLKHAFESQDECDAAFSMFDKDMNGDISMEEFEAVCVEIGRERKAILASLKDLDSVVGKLDECLTFVVVVIAILVFISLISTSAAGVLTSAGSTVLALSWLLSATAQEFLQSLIFVFVKHPFDVGDRVTIYGNTGANLKGDDYFVKEISLLFTEFKKMEGHVVQAPNNYLNTLFILNMRRSGGLAEAVPMTFKFGTTVEQLDNLRLKLLDFVKFEKREFQPNILTELRDIVEAHSINVNVVFFFKSNWQNEGLRLQRRNKFICAMMVAMQELGIEGPRMRYPGQKDSFPFYLQNIPFAAENMGRGGNPDNPGGLPPVREEGSQDEALLPQQPRKESTSDTSSLSRAVRPRQTTVTSRTRGESILGRPTRLDDIIERPRSESIAELTKRYDFSLGMEGNTSADLAGDVYADREPRKRIPISVTSPSVSRTRGEGSHSRERHGSHTSEMAHTTSRSATFGPDTHAHRGMGMGMLHRAGTDLGHSGTGDHTGSIASLHRNRFFRNRRSTESDQRMEAGMAGLAQQASAQPPTADGLPSSISGVLDIGGVPAVTQHAQRIDPRTGFTSPRAVRGDTNESGSLYRVVSPLTRVQSGSSGGTIASAGSRAHARAQASQMRHHSIVEMDEVPGESSQAVNEGEEQTRHTGV